jgi:hypothetical protein
VGDTYSLRSVRNHWKIYVSITTALQTPEIRSNQWEIRQKYTIKIVIKMHRSKTKIVMEVDILNKKSSRQTKAMKNNALD